MPKTRKYKQRGGFDFWGIFSSNKTKANNVNSVSNNVAVESKNPVAETPAAVIPVSEKKVNNSVKTTVPPSQSGVPQSGGRRRKRKTYRGRKKINKLK
jgi:hypothetical protein